MNLKNAVYIVLKRAKKPLSAKTITEIALKEGLITAVGKTPTSTLGAMIYTDIKQKRGESIFVKIKRGLFGLKEWGEKQYKEEVRSTNILSEVNFIVESLKETQFKSDSPADFENTIKNAFKFLGFEPL